MKYYRARWGVALHLISWLVLALCLAASLGGGLGGVLHLNSPFFGALTHGLWVLPLALAFACALFTVRGYVVTENTLFVKRLFWYTALPLDGLRSAQADPDAMRASLRTFGNGGFFSFSGYFWSRRLGAFRAYVTAPKRCVVLRFDQKTLVLSPEHPEDFAHALMAAPRPAEAMAQDGKILCEVA